MLHLALPVPTFCKMGVKPAGQPADHHIKKSVNVVLFFLFFMSCLSLQLI